ncbi:unannotated protein [freshwater metagenome]|uniref:Unannotated protein n=2 Tax=freshwater metagenome TaxID=449393 RepID=A0A6J6HAT0_9ZZZZ|nr:hypothetical protein [Actinomycetota bacterium]
MWRRLFSPKWLCIHIGVLALLVLMINLGFWQLHRLDAKRAFNSQVTARSTFEPVPVSKILTKDAEVTSLEWRKVIVEGIYVPSESVTIINRSQDGSAGYDSLVPLRTTADEVILVNRGFVPLSMKPPIAPSGTVQVMGYLRQSQNRSALGAVDSSDKNATEFQRFDIPRISQVVTGNIASMFLQRITENPATGQQWPAIVALPELDEGTHFSYAMQWFFFSLVALTAWVIVIRRKLSEKPTGVVAPEQTSV